MPPDAATADGVAAAARARPRRRRGPRKEHLPHLKMHDTGAWISAGTAKPPRAVAWQVGRSWGPPRIPNAKEPPMSDCAGTVGTLRHVWLDDDSDGKGRVEGLADGRSTCSGVWTRRVP